MEPRPPRPDGAATKEGRQARNTGLSPATDQTPGNYVSSGNILTSVWTRPREIPRGEDARAVFHWRERKYSGVSTLLGQSAVRLPADGGWGPKGLTDGWNSTTSHMGKVLIGWLLKSLQCQLTGSWQAGKDPKRPAAKIYYPGNSSSTGYYYPLFLIFDCLHIENRSWSLCCYELRAISQCLVPINRLPTKGKPPRVKQSWLAWSPPTERIFPAWPGLGHTGNNELCGGNREWIMGTDSIECDICRMRGWTQLGKWR